MFATAQGKLREDERLYPRKIPTWYFTNDVSHRPARLHVIQLILVQSEILLHARDKCIVDIYLVKVLDEVSQASESEDRRIELEQKPALFGRLVQTVPEVRLPLAARLSLNDV